MSVGEVDAEARKFGLGKWWYIVLFVLGPALVAGLFSLAPTIYTEMFKNAETLSYSVVRGPSLEADGIFQSIVALRVSNSGNTSLTNVRVLISADASSIKAVASQKGAIRPKVDTSSEETLVQAERLLPADQFDISLSVASTVAEPDVRFDVRSDQIVGQVQDIPTEEKGEGSGGLAVAGAILAAASVAAMSIFFITFPFGKTKFGVAIGPVYKNDFILLILGLSGVISAQDQLMFNSSNLTYIGAANALLIAGLDGDQQARIKCIYGLQALLFGKNVADESLEKIMQNLELLGFSLTSGEFASIQKSAQVMSNVARRTEVLKTFGLMS